MTNKPRRKQGPDLVLIVHVDDEETELLRHLKGVVLRREERDVTGRERRVPRGSVRAGAEGEMRGGEGTMTDVCVGKNVWDGCVLAKTCGRGEAGLEG